jgi:DNA-binding Lrp family transcriptional regulator
VKSESMRMSESLLKDSLRKLRDKGYIKIGYDLRNVGAADILLIHKDWQPEGWTLMKHVNQAFQDLKEVGLTEEFLVTVEAVPLSIYENERTGGPQHRLI